MGARWVRRTAGATAAMMWCERACADGDDIGGGAPVGTRAWDVAGGRAARLSGAARADSGVARDSRAGGAAATACGCRPGPPRVGGKRGGLPQHPLGMPMSGGSLFTTDEEE